MTTTDPSERAPGLLGQVEVEKLLKRALALSEADETEVTLATFNESLTRFAHNVIHQNVAEADAELEVRAAFGRRVGAASTNDLSPLGARRAAARRPPWRTSTSGTRRRPRRAACPPAWPR